MVVAYGLERGGGGLKPFNATFWRMKLWLNISIQTIYYVSMQCMNVKKNVFIRRVMCDQNSLEISM